MDLSIIIPVYNEELSINTLYKELKSVLGFLNKTYEIIFINDGSVDSTEEKIIELIKKDNVVRLITFVKNFGLSSALLAGFKHAIGDLIVSMDGDLQHDPKDIPSLLKEIDKGYDLVCGYRKVRSDNILFRRMPSVLANKLGRVMFNLGVHDFSTTLRAYKNRSIKGIVIFNGGHRFIPVLAKNNNLLIGEVIVSHRIRNHGFSKYGSPMRFCKVIKDAIILKINDICLKFGVSLYFKEAEYDILQIV